MTDRELGSPLPRPVEWVMVKVRERVTMRSISKFSGINSFKI